jgi:predicted Zn-dependent peptidase
VRVRQHRLPNGFQFAVVPRRDLASATIMLVVGVGSRHDPPGASGLAHTIEHVVFKGSGLYPTPARVNQTVSQLGGFFNGETDVEYTRYHIEMSDDNLLEALALLADVVIEPLFPPKEIAHELGVLREEIALDEEDDQNELVNAFEGLLLRGHPLANPIPGTMRSIARLSAEQIRTHHERYYRPNNFAMVVVTDQPTQAIARAIAQRFGLLRRGRIASQKRFRPRPAAMARTVTRATAGDQVFMQVGGFAPGIGQAGDVPMELLVAAMGGSLDTPLSTRLREELGFVYDLNAGIAAYAEAGIFTVTTSTEPDHAADVLRVMLEEYEVMATQPLAAVRRETARAFLLGEYEREWDDPVEQAADIARGMLSKKFLTMTDRQRAIRAVTAHDLEAARRRWLTPQNVFAGFFGPSPTIVRLRSQFLRLVR